MKKVVLGLSGGVDSALSAHLLKNQGYEVIGVYLENGSKAESDARKIANDVGIDFKAIDISEILEKNVITPFIDSYLRGETPIPCITCNPTVKFKILFQIADEIGADYVATGHYARLTELENGEKLLTKSLSKNDQSYMLYRLPKEYLQRLILPLGEYITKDDVRKDAEAFNIHIAKKADSMEICFIPNDDHGAFIENRGKNPPKGKFIDENGKVLGEHLGIHRYTLGQRRGLGIAAASRIFVNKIDVEHNTVVLSPQDVYKKEIEVINGTTIYNKYNTLESFDCTCKVRHSKTEYPAHIERKEEGFTVTFIDEARAPSPGQSAVFYEGNFVIGGGFIKK